MTKLRKFIPYVLILAAFLAGNFLGDSSSDKELERKYEQEQQYEIQESKRKDSIIIALEAESREIKEAMIQTQSLYADSLQRNKTAYNRLKKKYNEINLNRATVYELDSLVSALYP